MFGETFAYGLRLMTHVEFWISILLYCFVLGIFYLAVGYSMKRNEEKHGSAFVAFITKLFRGPLLQAIIGGIFLIELIPILSGGEDFASPEFLLIHWWSIAKAGVISTAVVFILSVIPFIRDQIIKVPGTTLFLQGTIIFHLLANETLTDIVKQEDANAVVLPSFTATVGLLLLLIVLLYIVSRFISFLLIKLKILDEYAIKRHTFLIGNFVGVFPAIFSLCIYCAYIRLLVIDVATKSLS
ncbi:hypothetical protein LK994_14090 [Ferruginibacter lapsinanis]|uniref:hypothetical protein n=1 Tax=Ferruginibacter lapsinanis TaxID=563172 RepID=UPI001E338B29|nr:hypothetical protein [Ferruginibacter lapsinanis]UEG49767.1 hypothetical protein LK994_14090 [Ferruginibacter lapsinanis]